VRSGRLAAVVGVAGLAACGGGGGLVADGVPIDLDVSHGPVLAQVRQGDGDPQPAVIDLLAPITVIDAAEDVGPTRREVDLTVLDTAGVPRAHLDVTATQLHACPAGAACQVGTDPDVQGVDVMIGGDALAGAAARFDFAAGQLTLLPDIAGDTAARGEMCDAELPSPFRGGGTLFLGGSVIDFPARRIAVGACLAFDQSVDAPAERGASVELVVSSGIGPTILTRSAYERWRVASGGGAEIASLPAARVWLPSGPVDGALGTIDRMALVGFYDDRRGPCRQVYAHHLLTDHNCRDGEFCPCKDAPFCKVPAIVELTPAEPIPVLIVDDEHPLLQALRTELRPRTAEVDGVLGTSALTRTVVDVDAPNDRVLVRCTATGCQVRPELITDEVRPTVLRCLELGAELPPLVDASVPDAAPPDAAPAALELRGDTMLRSAWPGNR